MRLIPIVLYLVIILLSSAMILENAKAGQYNGFKTHYRHSYIFKHGKF